MVAHTSEHADDELPLGAVSGVPAEDAERYLQALAAINLGVYDWNIETGRIEHPLLGQEVRRRWVEQPLTTEIWERGTSR